MTDSKNELFFKISYILCNNTEKYSAEECYSFHCNTNSSCQYYGKCRIFEKTLEQLQYIIQDLKEDIFLTACPGSGKTEVVGLKSAYEIKQWKNVISGITILTYTNKATDVITDRIQQFTGFSEISYPHYVGTIDSWIHKYILNPFGYLVTKYPGIDDDRSLRLIKNSSKSKFLNNHRYSTKKNFQNTGPIKANEFYFLDKDYEKIIFSSGDFPVDSKRSSTIINKELKIELKKIKKEFWKSGFILHQDVDIICYDILNQYPDICKLISNRFNVFIIDECQDLSSLKIDIFQLMKKSGSILHLVGDLDQSIFSYNHADCQKLIQFSKEEKIEDISLTRNFRSVQSIVNTCSKLIGTDQLIIGNQDIPDRNHCLLFCYRNNLINEIPGNFFNFLKENGYDVNNSAIIIRNNSLKKSLIGQSNDKVTNLKLVPTAIYFWSLNEIELKKESLQYFGEYLSAIFFTSSKFNYQRFNCPNDIPYYQWRLFLSNLLNKCVQSDQINDLTDTWANWRIKFNNFFPILFNSIKKEYEWLQSVEINNSALIKTSPKGETNSPVISTLNLLKEEFVNYIELSTIHSAKGKTYDCILLVSSPHNRGERSSGSGYWEHWLDITDAQGESARFAYVASSRPKLLLAWAIPEKNYENINIIAQLKNYGFFPYGSLCKTEQSNDPKQKTLEKWF